MGCGSSAPQTPELRRAIQLKAVGKQLDRLGVTRQEADALYTVFDGVDVSKDGFLQPGEFEKLLKLPAGTIDSKDASKQNFRSRLFRIFDRNNDGEISFSELLEGIFTFCTFTRYSLILLAFRLMDIDNSGTVDANEVSTLILEISRDPSFSKSLLDGIDVQSLAKEKGARVPLTDLKWTQFAVMYPAVLYPAAKVQEELRNRIYNPDWWRGVTARRSGPKLIKEVDSWTNNLRSAALSEGAFSTALLKIRDGAVAKNDVAPVNTAIEAQKEWGRLFGNERGVSGLVRTMSGRFVQAVTGGKASEGAAKGSGDARGGKLNLANGTSTPTNQGMGGKKSSKPANTFTAAEKYVDPFDSRRGAGGDPKPSGSGSGMYGKPSGGGSGMYSKPAAGGKSKVAPA